MLPLLFVYLVILGFLSLNPWLLPSSALAIGSISWDKLAHAVVYAGLSLLMLMSLRNWQRPLILSMFLVLLSCSLIGVFWEYCQNWFTLKRQFSLYDIAANIFGVVLGLLCFGLFKLAFNLISKAFPKNNNLSTKN